MAFRSDLEDIVYPDDSGELGVLQYRLGFTATTKLLVVVHLVHADAAFASPNTSTFVRDTLLNRILTDRLEGVPVNSIRLAVADDTGTFEYAIEVDIDDYIRSGNPYDAAQISSSGARVFESISLKSGDVIAGRTRVQTVHSDAVPPSTEVADAIA
jgi:hypothetical protein